MRALFVIAAIALAAFAANANVNLEFETGVNLTNADSDFSFRFINTNSIGITGIANLLTWTSISIDASTASSEAKASADAMLGVGVLPGLVNYPFALLAYAKGAAAVDAKIESFARNLISLNPQLDATFKGGVVGVAALGLVEMDPDNKPVGSVIHLNSPTLSACSKNDISGDEGNLKGIYCTYSPSGTPADITVTYVTSKRAGIMKYGNTPVSPRSLEMIVEVSGFKLTNDKNHARLILGLLTASGAGSVEGSANIVHREGLDDLYVAASTKAVVNGNGADVDVELKSGANELDTVSEAILKVALGGNIDAQIANVDFPAGESNFVYDPALGAGKDVYEAGASTVALSAFAALLCVLLYLF